MLLFGGAVAALVLLWLLVVRPLGDALSDAKSRHGDAIVALAETRAQVASIRAAEGRDSPQVVGAVDALVSQAATEAGFPVTRLDRHSGTQATLVMESIRAQAFFAWVNQMETGRGLVVDRMTATTNSDQTLAVQITFSARAG